MVLGLVSVGVIAGFISPYIAPLLKDLIIYFGGRLFSSVDGSNNLLEIVKTLLLIQAIVNSCESRLIKDEAVLLWMKELKEVVYDAGDLLDEVKAEAAKEQVSSSSPFKPNTELKRRIKRVRERLDQIAKVASNFSIGERLNNVVRQPITNRLATSSFVVESDILGRDTDKNNIIEKLCRYDDSDSNTIRHKAFVLPIVGFGGMGKTSIAQLVYNDERVNKYYDIRIWLHVSDVFDLRRLVLEMLESITKNVLCELTNWNTLQEILMEELKGKTFLLVLDDLWCVDNDAWGGFLDSLSSGKNGSKVVVTTRNRSVAQMSAMMQPYFLNGLSEDDTWSLFKTEASLRGESLEQQKLSSIGKQIVEKVEGSPLAIRTLGRVLKSNLKEDFWRSIAKSELWEIQQEEKDILPSLKLSYHALPAHLKQCFAFCAIFRKEYSFEKTKLVQMWMAQGYIHSHGKHRMEDIGSSYLDELMNKSFLQDEDKYSVVMHNLMRDLAKYVSMDECCSIEDKKNTKLSENFRHLSVISGDLKLSEFAEMKILSCLRTLLFFGSPDSVTGNELKNLFEKIKCIRVLDLSRLKISELPKKVSDLKHLRYLDVSENKISQLPDTISELYHLQTLKLLGNSLTVLPENIWKLRNLRHLEAASNLISNIPRIGNLTGLQELKEFVVNDEEGFSIAELKCLTELRGSLSVKQLNKATKLANMDVLNNKEYLEELSLEWSNDEVADVDSTIAGTVIGCLQPHPNLKVLTIEGYTGLSPEWLSKPILSNLEQLDLIDCPKWVLLPSLGDLCFLSTLGMTGMCFCQRNWKSVLRQQWFPVAQEADFSNMPIWNKWLITENKPVFPLLSEISITNCPKLEALPLLPCSLTNLKLNDVGITTLPEVRPVPERSQSGQTEIKNHPLKTLIIHSCNNLSSFTEGWFGAFSLIEQIEIVNCGRVLNDSMCQHLKSLIPVHSVKIFNEYRDRDLNEVYKFLENLTVLELLDVSYSRIGSERSCSVKYEHLHHQQGMTIPTVTIKVPNRHTEPPECLWGVNSMSKLSITNCPQLTCLSTEKLKHLTQLKSLNITECREITSLGLESLCSLSHLSIIDCPQLRISSFDGLSSCSLEHLKIKASLFSEELLQNLTSLKRLEIRSCQELTNFQNVEGALRQLLYLQSLEIGHCGSLQHLPSNLKHFPALSSLDITSCSALTGLPNDGVPASLEELTITGCAPLAAQCRNRGGEDWGKIAHVKKLKVDGNLIPNNYRGGNYTLKNYILALCWIVYARARRAYNRNVQQGV
ncbi:LOW QUALITY PROTEIN: putative disease resistance protein RGA3 [Curcuma longa]|uniref:LOW QUALITY PROTEIN: putative disease resistance protein RGA3 n=1 Tax=Curcuma longa TaxID=136217 RepID=UPI003D9F44E4